MAAKDFDDIVSFNKEVADFDIDDVTLEELERRLELVVGLAPLEDCTNYSCTGLNCTSDVCNGYAPSPPPPTDCTNYSCDVLV